MKSDRMERGDWKRKNDRQGKMGEKGKRGINIDKKN